MGDMLLLMKVLRGCVKCGLFKLVVSTKAVEEGGRSTVVTGGAVYMTLMPARERRASRAIYTEYSRFTTIFRLQLHDNNTTFIIETSIMTVESLATHFSKHADTNMLGIRHHH